MSEYQGEYQEEAMSEYHFRDGWYFKRHNSGAVELEQRGLVGVHQRLFIPSSQWCSIIAAVSRQGESAEQYVKAEEFHA